MPRNEKLKNKQIAQFQFIEYFICISVFNHTESSDKAEIKTYSKIKYFEFLLFLQHNYMNMKKLVSLLSVMLMSIAVSAQMTIIMEKDGGVYKVPCTVNGVKMKFIFDTGAASVSMSQAMAQFLLDGDYLSSSDIIGSGQSELADGSIVNHAIVNLSDVEIGGMHIHNIKATVIEGQNAPLLLGQTAISELGRVTIDGNKLVIHAAENDLTQEQIDQLEKQIDRLIKAESWAAAIDCLLKMENAVGLSEYGLENLCYCFCMDRQYEECIQSCNKWIREFDVLGTDSNKISVYDFLAESYYSGLSNYKSALLWYQKRIDILENADLSDDYVPSYFDSKQDIRTRASTYRDIGDCYAKIESFYNAREYYRKAINLYCQYIGTSIDHIEQGKIQDEELGFFLYGYADCCYNQKKETDGDEIMKLAALCGYNDAIVFCKKYNINYQTKSSKLFD